MKTRTTLLFAAVIGAGLLSIGLHRQADAPASLPADPPTSQPAPQVMDRPTSAPVVQATPRTVTAVANTLLGPHRLPTQHFRVDAERDTVLHTQGGSALHIPAKAFAKGSGTVRGPVDVQVIEALRPADLVLGGLLTVYKGKALESGGSFCITATSKGRDLHLAEGKALDMAVPSKAKKAGVKLFPGSLENGQVVWQAPEPMEAPAVDRPIVQAERFQLALRTNVTYLVDGFEHPLDAPQEVHDKVVELAWANGGLWLTRDSSFQVGKHTVRFFANDSVTTMAVAPVMNLRMSGVQQPGANSFLEDANANYVFQVKQLGWANIDRLLNDKRTARVDLRTTIRNSDVLQDVRIALVMKSHNLYIPGYECLDGSYGFSHGDQEPMQLPIGAKAMVLATAVRNGKACYALQEFEIARTGHLELDLLPTTSAQLRETLMAAL